MEVIMLQPILLLNTEAYTGPNCKIWGSYASNVTKSNRQNYKNNRNNNVKNYKSMLHINW